VPKQQLGIDAQHLWRIPQHVDRFRTRQWHRNARAGHQIGERVDVGNIRTRLNERRNQCLSFVAFPQLQQTPEAAHPSLDALVAAAMGAEQIKLMPHLVHGAGP